MANLHFKGPFHFEHIYDYKNPKGNCGEINSLEPPGKPGIYIWGFMFWYDKDNNTLTCFVNFNNKTPIPDFICINNANENLPIGVDYSINGWKFIPYYVGLDAKLLGWIINRHYKIQSGNRWQYTRLTMDAYKSFFLNGNFPVLIKNTRKTTKSRLVNSYVDKYSSHYWNSSIEYFNTSDVLQHIYGLSGILNTYGIPNKGINLVPSGKRIDYPYNIQLDNSINMLMGNYISPGSSSNNIDSLNHIINDLNNFWFCYAESIDPSTLNPINADEDMEAQTFYSLKGVTISETKPFINLSNTHTISASPTCDNIFKKAPNSGPNFKIYTGISAQDFPGY